jgi:hypothetical protein
MSYGSNKKSRMIFPEGSKYYHQWEMEKYDEFLEFLKENDYDNLVHLDQVGKR